VVRKNNDLEKVRGAPLPETKTIQLAKPPERGRKRGSDVESPETKARTDLVGRDQVERMNERVVDDGEKMRNTRRCRD
jgi:hypothetical protein